MSLPSGENLVYSIQYCTYYLSGQFFTNFLQNSWQHKESMGFPFSSLLPYKRFDERITPFSEGSSICKTDSFEQH